MSKRKHGSGTAEPPSKVQVTATPSQYLIYETDDEEEALIVRRINGHIVVLEDQRKALNAFHPVSVGFKEESITPFKSILRDHLVLRFARLFLDPTKFTLLGLSEREFSWSELSAVIRSLREDLRKAELNKIYDQIEAQIVKLGPLHEACIELQLELDRLHVTSSHEFRDNVAKVDPNHVLEAGSHIICKGMTMDNFANIARTIASYLRLFTPAPPAENGVSSGRFIGTV